MVAPGIADLGMPVPVLMLTVGAQAYRSALGYEIIEVRPAELPPRLDISHRAGMPVPRRDKVPVVPCGICAFKHMRQRAIWLDLFGIAKYPTPDYRDSLLKVQSQKFNFTFAPKLLPPAPRRL